VARRGVTGLRFQDVAVEAGVSIGTVQHYFGNRERLLVETFAWETEQAMQRWVAASSNGASAWEEIAVLVDIVLRPETFRERWTRWLQFWAAYAREPELRTAMGAVYERWRSPFRHAVEAGIASGEFRPAHDVDAVVDRAVALVDGLALQVLLEAPGMSLGRMRELVLDGLAAELGVERAPGRAGRRRAAATG
jgi:AcrR family transcriptional regulator